MITPRHASHGSLAFLGTLAGLLAGCAAPTQSAPGVGSPSVATAVAVATPAAPVVAAPPAPLTTNDFLASVRAPFDACYTQARKSNPNLPRTNVEITFTRDENGKLLNVDFVYRNRLDAAAKNCMRTAAEAVTFPPALRGTQTGTLVFTPP